MGGEIKDFKDLLRPAEPVEPVTLEELAAAEKRVRVIRSLATRMLQETKRGEYDLVTSSKIAYDISRGYDTQYSIRTHGSVSSPETVKRYIKDGIKKGYWKSRNVKHRDRGAVRDSVKLELTPEGRYLADAYKKFKEDTEEST